MSAKKNSTNQHQSPNPSFLYQSQMSRDHFLTTKINTDPMNTKIILAITILTTIALTAISTTLISVSAQNASNQDNAIVQPFYRQSHDLDILYLDDLVTTVTCPGGDTNTLTWHGNSNKKKIQYSWNDSELFTGANTQADGTLSTGSGGTTTYFHINNARVDGPGNYFTMIVTVDDNGKHVCKSFDPLFTMDIVGKCDGTMFEGISREPLGFNVTGSNFLVSCIP